MLVFGVVNTLTNQDYSKGGVCVLTGWLMVIVTSPITVSWSFLEGCKIPGDNSAPSSVKGSRQQSPLPRAGGGSRYCLCRVMKQSHGGDYHIFLNPQNKD